ncbi:hypothetical protein DAEQUDRAFT_559896 [Daedalea quercina L-15889]|uniref:Uncharacterized protein n=1 Tax=Daedalea quercina L-15889 TaxID=1314783 RepID=A0A165M0M4_9APHY|nr:hypothetical protein DAEQUDRAFT_559896 [Daedalea quercina L-15889]
MRVVDHELTRCFLTNALICSESITVSVDMTIVLGSRLSIGLDISIEQSCKETMHIVCFSWRVFSLAPSAALAKWTFFNSASTCFQKEIFFAFTVLPFSFTFIVGMANHFTYVAR